MFQGELSKLSGSGTSYTLSDYSYLPSFKTMYIRVQSKIASQLNALNQSLIKHFKDFVLSTIQPPYPQSILYRQTISVFIVSVSNCKLLKATMQQEEYLHHLHVIVFDEDSIQQKYSFNWKAIKLITNDLKTIVNFLLELYQYCYYELMTPISSSKFTVHNRISTTIYYPHNFELINKMLQKKQFSDYSIVFCSYKKGSEQLVKDQVKKIKNQQRRSEAHITNQKIKQQNKIRVIIITSQESIEHFLSSKDYELLIIKRDSQQQKFVKQFLQVCSTKVQEIDLVTCNILYFIVPYFDEELKNFFNCRYSQISNLKLLEYSSVTSLKQKITQINPPNVGLIFCDSSFETINILAKASPFLKIIVYNYHQKVKIMKMYQKLQSRQDAQIFIDKIVENRAQFKDPLSGLFGYQIYMLLDENENTLIEQLSNIFNNRNDIKLGTFQDLSHLNSLLTNTLEHAKTLIITRKNNLKEHIKLLSNFKNSKILVLTSGHVEYNHLILDVFKKESNLIRFLMSIIMKIMSTNSMAHRKIQKPIIQQRYSVDHAIQKNALQNFSKISQIPDQKDQTNLSDISSMISSTGIVSSAVENQTKVTKTNTFVSKICELTISTIQTPKFQRKQSLQKYQKSNSGVLPIQCEDSISYEHTESKKYYKRSQFTQAQNNKNESQVSTNERPLKQLNSNRFKQKSSAYFNKSSSISTNISTNSFEHIHIYYQKNLPIDIMNFILERCESSTRFIPHQLVNYLQLIRNTKTYSSQLFISVLKNFEVHNQLSKVLNSNHKIFYINNLQQVQNLKQFIYQLSEIRSNNSKMIQNKLSRIECQRMINILNPQQRIDPLVFSNIQCTQSQQYIEKQQSIMYTQQQLQIKIQSLLKIHSSLKILIPSKNYNEFQSSVIYLQRFKFQVYSDQSQLYGIISSLNDPAIVLITKIVSSYLNHDKNVLVALSPYISEFIPMYQISSIIKLLLLLNNQNNNKPSNQSLKLYK